MAKIRAMVSYLKPNLTWIIGAALLLPWVAGTSIPLSPRPGELAA